MENQEIKKGNVYDYILALCTSPSHGKFDKPFNRSGLVYATNSFLAVRFNTDKALHQYEEGTVEAESVFKAKNIVNPHVLTLTTHEILGLVSQYGLFLDNRRECKACNGRGEAECFHCGNDSECEECSGSGKNGEAKPVYTFAFTEKTMKLDKYHFTPQYLHIVGLIAAVIGDTEVRLEFRPDKLYVGFSDGTEMIVMLQHKS